MQIFVDRFNSRIQVILDKIYAEYEYIELRIGRHDWESATILDKRYPQTNYFVSFSFSTNQVADFFLVGIRDDVTELIDKTALGGNIATTNLMKKRQLWNLQRDKEKALIAAEPVTVYIRQSGERCSCWNEAYQQADVNCETCGGTGYSQSFIGLKRKVFIPSEEQFTFVKDSDGEENERRLSGCWTDGFPRMFDKDIIERENGERYYVQITRLITFADTLIEQQFDLVSVRDYSPFTFDLVKN